MNGINTFRGGRHVDMLCKQICDSLVTMYNAKKKKEATALKAADVKQYLWLFVNATIENPRFSGQTKEELSSTQAQFGSRCELSDKFLMKLYKSGIIERAMRVSEFNAPKGLSKLGGKKKIKLNDVEKLGDANRAGGRESAQCTPHPHGGDSARRWPWTAFPPSTDATTSASFPQGQAAERQGRDASQDRGQQGRSRT